MITIKELQDYFKDYPEDTYVAHLDHFGAPLQIDIGYGCQNKKVFNYKLNKYEKYNVLILYCENPGEEPD